MYYRSSVMNGNNIKTVFGNWGVIGQPNDSRPRGSWRYNSDGYIGDVSLLIGVELPIRDYDFDGKADTIHSVITCTVARPTSSRDEDPSTGEPWTFTPVSGFFNPKVQSVAISNKPETWPDNPEWKDSTGNVVWKGLLGPGTFAGDLETFFQMDDQHDQRVFKTYGSKG